MNAGQRKEVAEIVESLEELKGKIEILRDAEADKLGNMPESLQSSERALRISNGVDDLDQALEYCDNCVEYLNSACA